LKAVCITKHGSPDVIKYLDIDEPECNRKSIKVKIKASSINHLDLWVRKGIENHPVKFPRILGSDGAGEIIELGADVRGYNIGDDVVIQPGIFSSDSNFAKEGMENYSSSYGILGETCNGVQADFVVLDVGNIYPMPKNLSYEEISSMTLTFMTAYQMLVERANLNKNENVLIYGATSGVGSAAIQIAKDKECRVYATVGSNEKENFAYNMGADVVMNHNDKNFYSMVKEKLGRNRFDVIFEHIGDATWGNTMKLLGRGGRVVTCGATTGANVQINLKHLFFKQQSILGSTMSNIRVFRKVMDLVESGVYYPVVDKILSFKEAAIAHQIIEDRTNLGKIVLTNR